MLNLKKSNLRSKLLLLFFNHPEKRLYLREIARLIGEDPTNLSRELKKFEKEGIFLHEKKGNLKFFSLNKRFPLLKELRIIVNKTIGTESELSKAISRIKGINTAFIYGSYAKGNDTGESDIDLFIVGRIDTELLLEKINHLEKKIGREINYRIFSEKEYNKAINEKNSFIINILKNKRIYLTGNEEQIGKT
jgi:predicted nucleotidyltransferase